MNKIHYLSLLLIILSCSQTKNNETATDSTQHEVTDPAATQIEEMATSSSTDESGQSSSIDETEEPFSGITTNFPEMSMDALTNDSLEVKINNRIGQLLQVYDTMQYATITSSYAWERPYCYPSQDGPCMMGIETEEETRKWFFDRFNQLRGYSITTGGNEATPSSTLYLFSNDSLIAISEQTVDNSDAGIFVDQVRMLASSCPKCGMAASTFDGQLNGEVRYLNEPDLTSRQTQFYESMTELIQILKEGRKKAKEDDFDFIFSVNRTKDGNADEKSKAIIYPVEFRVTKNLYPNYISKQ